LFQSGFRLRARTPAKRLKFESLTAHQAFQVLPFTSFQSGFRMRARTPAKRLKFESSLRNRSLENSP
jgi:ribosomal protein L34